MGKPTKRRKSDGIQFNIGKRIKVQAQRKFAQGAVILPLQAPKDVPSVSNDLYKNQAKKADFVVQNTPKIYTEDFLTFLCFKGSPSLPSHLRSPSFLQTQNIYSTPLNNNVGVNPLCTAQAPPLPSPRPPPPLPQVQGFIPFGVRKQASQFPKKATTNKKPIQTIKKKFCNQKILTRASDKVASSSNAIQKKKPPALPSNNYSIATRRQSYSQMCVRKTVPPAKTNVHQLRRNVALRNRIVKVSLNNIKEKNKQTESSKKNSDSVESSKDVPPKLSANVVDKTAKVVVTKHSETEIKCKTVNIMTTRLKSTLNKSGDVDLAQTRSGTVRQAITKKLVVKSSPKSKVLVAKKSATPPDKFDFSSDDDEPLYKKLTKPKKNDTPPKKNADEKPSQASIKTHLTRSKLKSPDSSAQKLSTLIKENKAKMPIKNLTNPIVKCSRVTRHNLIVNSVKEMKKRKCMVKTVPLKSVKDDVKIIKLKQSIEPIVKISNEKKVADKLINNSNMVKNEPPPNKEIKNAVEQRSSKKECKETITPKLEKSFSESDDEPLAAKLLETVNKICLLSAEAKEKAQAIPNECLSNNSSVKEVILDKVIVNDENTKSLSSTVSDTNPLPSYEESLKIFGIAHRSVATKDDKNKSSAQINKKQSPPLKDFGFVERRHEFHGNYDGSLGSMKNELKNRQSRKFTKPKEYIEQWLMNSAQPFVNSTQSPTNLYNKTFKSATHVDFEHETEEFMTQKSNAFQSNETKLNAIVNMTPITSTVTKTVPYDNTETLNKVDQPVKVASDLRTDQPINIYEFDSESEIVASLPRKTKFKDQQKKSDKVLPLITANNVNYVESDAIVPQIPNEKAIVGTLGNIISDAIIASIESNDDLMSAACDLQTEMDLSCDLLNTKEVMKFPSESIVPQKEADPPNYLQTLNQLNEYAELSKKVVQDEPVEKSVNNNNFDVTMQAKLTKKQFIENLNSDRNTAKVLVVKLNNLSADELKMLNKNALDGDSSLHCFMSKEDFIADVNCNSSKSEEPIVNYNVLTKNKSNNLTQDSQKSSKGPETLPYINTYQPIVKNFAQKLTENPQVHVQNIDFNKYNISGGKIVTKDMGSSYIPLKQIAEQGMQDVKRIEKLEMLENREYVCMTNNLEKKTTGLCGKFMPSSQLANENPQLKSFTSHPATPVQPDSKKTQKATDNIKPAISFENILSTPQNLNFSLNNAAQQKDDLKKGQLKELAKKIESEDHLFYIPLQGVSESGVDMSNHLIEGVAVKMDTQGPNGVQQRVIMRAKLVRKSQVNKDIKKNVGKQTGPMLDIVRSVREAFPNATIHGDSIMSEPKSVDVVPTIQKLGLSTISMKGNQATVRGKNQTTIMPPIGMNVMSSKSSTCSSQSSCSVTGRNSRKSSDASEPISQKNNTSFPQPEDTARIVEAPIFQPTEKEFQDPLEFIEKISPIASKYGICRIIPPPSFRSECKISDDMRFTPHNQYLHRMLYRWGPSSREMCAIKKYLATQSVMFKQPPTLSGIEVDLPKLYHIVQNMGGLNKVLEKKMWHRVAEEMSLPSNVHYMDIRLDEIYCKYLLPYDTLLPDERKKLFESVDQDWEKRQKRMMARAANPINFLSGSDNEECDYDITEDIEECITRGKSITLCSFLRTAKNTMTLHFGKVQQPPPEEVESKFWKYVTNQDSHVCVSTGSIDSSVWGYGFPNAKIKNSPIGKHPWNLKVLTNNSGSVLRSLGPIMGVTVPTLHVGMLFSTCCWYRDPHGLPWIEYLHDGAPKIWYGVPDSQSAKFKETLSSIVPSYCQKKTIWLLSDTTMVPPTMLTNHGVSLCRTIQNPGEFILVFPKAFTSSVCTGYSVSESVYFALNSWLDTAQQDFVDIRNSCEPSMFSLERLIVAISEDVRTPYHVLMKVLPALNKVIQMEKQNREVLFNMGLKMSERTQNIFIGRKKVAKRQDEVEECHRCRSSLSLSMLYNDADNSVFCLTHAAEFLSANQTLIDKCKLLYMHSIDELERILSKLLERINTLANKKCGKAK